MQLYFIPIYFSNSNHILRTLNPLVGYYFSLYIRTSGGLEMAFKLISTRNVTWFQLKMSHLLWYWFSPLYHTPSRENLIDKKNKNLTQNILYQGFGIHQVPRYPYLSKPSFLKHSYSLGRIQTEWWTIYFWHQRGCLLLLSLPHKACYFSIYNPSSSATLAPLSLLWLICGWYNVFSTPYIPSWYQSTWVNYFPMSNIAVHNNMTCDTKSIKPLDWLQHMMGNTCEIKMGFPATL